MADTDTSSSQTPQGDGGKPFPGFTPVTGAVPIAVTESETRKGSDGVQRMASVTQVVGEPFVSAAEQIRRNNFNVGVGMKRSRPELDDQSSLFDAIRQSTERMSFANYRAFIDQVMALAKPGPEASFADKLSGTARGKNGWGQGQFENPRGLSNYSGTRSYDLLKEATELFVQGQCGIFPRDNTSTAPPFVDKNASDGSTAAKNDRWNRLTAGSDGALPYINVIAQKLGFPLNRKEHDDCGLCVRALDDKLRNPCMIELIWSYWMEQGMLVQSVNALSMRFQNLRTADVDVLARFDLDPLRPINNLLWGYIQDEINRLTVVRRSYEYDHHYGLRLEGKALAGRLNVADSRTQFLEAFHNFLRECARYYRAVTNTFVNPDTYPALNSLKELQLILTEGMHNQYGDLPSTARVEMMTQQYLLAQPEMLQFIGGRVMVPYAEPWMMYVDTIRQMHGWGDTGIRHFRDLAIFGERILLGVRFGNWHASHDELAAAVFMNDSREEVQGYIHAYRAVTGVDPVSYTHLTLPTNREV